MNYLLGYELILWSGWEMGCGREVNQRIQKETQEDKKRKEKTSHSPYAFFPLPPYLPLREMLKSCIWLWTIEQIIDNGVLMFIYSSGDAFAISLCIVRGKFASWTTYCIKGLNFEWDWYTSFCFCTTYMMMLTLKVIKIIISNSA